MLVGRLCVNIWAIGFRRFARTLIISRLGHWFLPIGLKLQDPGLKLTYTVLPQVESFCDDKGAGLLTEPSGPKSQSGTPSPQNRSAKASCPGGGAVSEWRPNRKGPRFRNTYVGLIDG